MRFANTGDGLLHSDCTERTPSVCGLLNRLTPDPGADINAEEADRLALAFDEAVPGNGGFPARSALDIQPQELPVIFLPGSWARASRAARRRSGRASRSRT